MKFSHFIISKNKGKCIFNIKDAIYYFHRKKKNKPFRSKDYINLNFSVKAPFILPLPL